MSTRKVLWDRKKGWCTTVNYTGLRFSLWEFFIAQRDDKPTELVLNGISCGEFSSTAIDGFIVSVFFTWINQFFFKAKVWLWKKWHD